jgi:hypothetical protein
LQFSRKTKNITRQVQVYVTGHRVKQSGAAIWLSISAVIASEAKQSIAPHEERMDCRVASLLVDRSRIRLHDLAARCAQSFAFRLPSEIRGRREDRVRAAPAVSRAKQCIKHAHEHTGLAETHRPSLRNGFTAYTISSW